MLIGNIYLTQTHLMLRDVDGSEVSLTLDDCLDVYTFVKDHLQEIEAQRQVNWQEYNSALHPGSDQTAEGVQ
jgi:hypothetical protein